MSLSTLRPWSELVRLHPDVEAGSLTDALFAIDLGAIAARDANVPVVYRDPGAFFRATYLTGDLRRLLDEVLGSLAGQAGYNRVLKLRTPFGGGKSHTLAVLLHAARDRAALAGLPEAQGLAQPGDVADAVFDGEKFDARDGKTLPDGRVIRTMWGWLAWQIDPERAYPLVQGHDEDRIAPGGDRIQELLTTGAGGRPVLILLDEVLKYMERAGAVPLRDSTLQRQAMDFFQNLTVEVANSPNAVLVYSLQWSARQAMGNVALLQMLDQLAARVDQLREPVSGDEILAILQRRLLAAPPDSAVTAAVAEAYAETLPERQQAAEEGLRLRARMLAAYPFHPALIDVMQERWAAVDAFQRTRGALRFLASCLHSVKRDGGGRPLLGPGDAPLGDEEVRLRLLKELGAQSTYDPVIRADIEGPNARAHRIDDRLARETPALSGIRPAARLATAILLASFGGLRRGEESAAETLPPGISESELLAACVGPDLDHITATAVLADLRKSCLYLHHDGVRYLFKTDANMIKVIEDAEQEVARQETQGGESLVRTRIRELLDQRLAGHHEAVVWPARSQDVADKEPRFLLAYLPLEFAARTRGEQEAAAREMLRQDGARPRRYRNGLGLAVPDRRQVEPLRRAVRYLLAIERVEGRKGQLRLQKEQLDELKEQRNTHAAAAEAALRDLYGTVYLPRVEAGEIILEEIARGGRPLQATGVHERVMELLTSQGIPRVYSSVTPQKIMERLRLGESLADGEPPRLGIGVAEVVEAFYRDLDPPRLTSAAAIQQAVARGVEQGAFGYTSAAYSGLGPDNRYQVPYERVVFERTMTADEVDLSTGFVMLPSAIPLPPEREVCPRCGEQPCQCTIPPVHCPKCGQSPCVCEVRERCPRCGQWPCACAPVRRTATYAFRATRAQLFNAFSGLANLSDKSDEGKISVRVEGHSEDGYDASWLRNAVEEPLEEAGVEQEESAR